MSAELGARRLFTRSTLHRGLGLGVGVLLLFLVWGGPRQLTRSRTVTAPAGTPGAASGEVVAKPVPALAVALPPTTAATIAPAAPATACPAEMALVDGEYCTAVEHDCKEWLDDDLLPYARCARYEPPARCTGKRVKLRFCIDRLEYTPPSEHLPQNYASFITASKVCEALGKRVCTESEWNFACEGPEMLPYPYGWSREAVCNQDRTDLYEPNPRKQVLKDWRSPSGEQTRCRSPFGVYDMTGNMDEPVLREAQRYNYPFRNGLKGGWWMAGRNRCRPATTAHDDHYRDIQIGIRCCGEAGSNLLAN